MKAAILAAPAAGTPDAIGRDIVDTAIAAGDFSTLSNALKAAHLVDTLRGAGPFTVFAPTDAAFKKLPAGTIQGLYKDRTKLAAILTRHMLPGLVMAKDVKSGDAKTIEGSALTVKASDDGVSVDTAKVIKADIEASNGVIHAIDTVVMPA